MPQGISIELFIQHPWLTMLVAYILGALPFAVWVGKLAGNDPRQQGSGNPGASNVTRVMGFKWGILTLLLDAGKAALACWLALPLGLGWGCLAAGIAVFAHCTTPFLGFRGGRGVACTLGSLCILHPGLMFISLFIWICMLMTTRKPAWASLVTALVIVFASHMQGVADEIRTFAVASASIILIRHWVYIQVLLGKKKKKKSATHVTYQAKKIKKKNRNKKRPETESH